MRTLKFESADDIRVHKGALKMLLYAVNYLLEKLEDAKITNEIDDYTFNIKTFNFGYDFYAYTSIGGVLDKFYSIDIRTMQANKNKLRITFDFGFLIATDIILTDSNEKNKTKITNIIEKCIIKSEVNNNKVLEGVC